MRVPNRPPTLEEWSDDGTYRPEKIDPAIVKRIEDGEWKRAGGGCFCVCGNMYSEHRPILGANFLTLLCDNRIVKL